VFTKGKGLEALLARGTDLVRTIYAEVALQARVEAQDAARADKLAVLREANRALELKVDRLEERAEHATRMEADLRETRSTLAKAGDVQQ